MTREEALTRWRELRTMKARADQRLLELIMHPSATPAHIQEVVADARMAHEKCKEAKTVLINKFGWSGWV